MSDSAGRKTPIVLVTALKPCHKCEACEALVGRLRERYPGVIEFTKLPANAPEASELGVVMPPMLIVDDLVASAGRVPTEEALCRLIELQALEASPER